MKIIHREFGASEAGIALSVVTVVVIALGYAAMQVLSGSTDAPTVEIRDITPGEVVAKEVSKSGPQEVLPQVLPAQESDGRDVLQVSQRPIWEPKPFAEISNEIDLSGKESPWPSADELPVGFAPLGEMPR